MSVQVFRFTLLISEGLFTYFQKTLSLCFFFFIIFVSLEIPSFFTYHLDKMFTVFQTPLIGAYQS